MRVDEAMDSSTNSSVIFGEAPTVIKQSAYKQARGAELLERRMGRGRGGRRARLWRADQRTKISVASAAEGSFELGAHKIWSLVRVEGTILLRKSDPRGSCFSSAESDSRQAVAQVAHQDGEGSSLADGLGSCG